MPRADADQPGRCRGLPVRVGTMRSGDVASVARLLARLLREQ